MATDAPGIALGILTADCAPVLFADPQARVIGAAHAGWKGALGGVMEAALGAMEGLGAARAPHPRRHRPVHQPERITKWARIPRPLRRGGSGQCPIFHRLGPAGAFPLRSGRLCGGAACCRGNRAMWAGFRPAPMRASADFFSFRRTTHRGESDYGRQVSAIALAGRPAENRCSAATWPPARRFTAPAPLLEPARALRNRQMSGATRGGGLRERACMGTWTGRVE